MSFSEALVLSGISGRSSTRRSSPLRKISGGSVSESGRQARDAMLGLAKTCRKLKIPFFDYLGARLGIPGPHIPHLATLVSPAPG